MAAVLWQYGGDTARSASETAAVLPWQFVSCQQYSSAVAGASAGSLGPSVSASTCTRYVSLNTCLAWWCVPACVQVLVATSTLAWGVNTPAHLVIIKGTEFYDAPTRCLDSGR